MSAMKDRYFRPGGSSIQRPVPEAVGEDLIHSTTYVNYD